MSEHIQINDIAPWTSQAGDGTTVAVPVPFPFLDSADLSVWLNGAVQNEGSDYTVTGAGETAGGTVTFSQAPAIGATVTVLRDMAISRTSDFLAGNALQADSLNTELDRLTMAAQQAEDAARRALRGPDHDQGSVNALPDADSRANRMLSFDASGEPEAGPLSSLLDDVGSITTNAAAASASALSAEASAAAAEASADDAADDAAGIAALVQNIPAMTNATGDGTQTSFTLNQNPVDEAALLVTLDGVVQHLSAYSVSAGNIVFTAAPPNGALIEVRDLSSTAIIDADDVAALALIDGDIASVAAIHSDVTAVAADAADIGLVADDITNVNSVAGSIANVNIVAGDLTDINAVAADAADIGTVAANIADVSTVAGDIADVSAVAADAADIGTVAANIANVNAYVDNYALSLFRLQFPNLPVPGKAMTLYDGASGSELAVTRASTANTRRTKQRLLETVGANALRYHHKPETGEPQGILIEPQFTNLVLQSDNLDNASWTKSGGAVTADQGVASDGITSLDKWVPTSGTAQSTKSLNQSITTVSGDAYTISFEVDSAGYTDVVVGFGTTSVPLEVRFDLATGTVAATKNHPSAPTSVSSAIQHLGGGRYRLTVVGTAAGTSHPVYIKAGSNPTTWSYGFNLDSDGTTGVNVGKAQVTRGAISLSQVATTTAQVTVDSDLVTLDAGAQDWFALGAQEGTILMDIDFDWVLNGGAFFALRQTHSSGPGFYLRNLAGTAKLGTRSGAAPGDSTSLRLNAFGSMFSPERVISTGALGRHRIAIAWDRDNIAVSIDGGAALTDTVDTPLATGTAEVAIGNIYGTTNGMAGAWRELVYWPAKLADADLATLTAL